MIHPVKIVSYAVAGTAGYNNISYDLYSDPFFSRDSRHTAASRHTNTLLLCSCTREIERSRRDTRVRERTHTQRHTHTTARRPTVWHGTATQPPRSPSRSSSTGSRRPSWRCRGDLGSGEGNSPPTAGLPLAPHLSPVRHHCMVSSALKPLRSCRDASA